MQHSCMISLVPRPHPNFHMGPGNEATCMHDLHMYHALTHQNSTVRTTPFLSPYHAVSVMKTYVLYTCYESSPSEVHV